MLPDLPSLKRDIQRVLDKKLQRDVQAKIGVFSESPKHQIHEGNRMRIMRGDGSVDESTLQEASAEILLRHEEIPNLTPEARLQKLSEMSDQLAQQIASHMFRRIDETLDKAGQVFDNAGKPFGPETFFSTLERMQFEFDPKTGEHSRLSIAIHPDHGSKVREVFAQMERDPVLQKRYEELVERKRRDWRDREASRKLVG